MKDLPPPIRWIRDRIQHRVGLWTYSYDPDADVCYLDYDTLRRKDLPAEAIGVRGMGGSEYFLDMDGRGRFPLPGHCTAVDLYNWMSNNAIDDALTTAGKVQINLRLLAYAAVGAAALALFLWYFSKGGS